MPERKYRWLHLAGPLLVAASLARGAAPVATMTEILAAAPASVWRPLADDHTLCMDLPAGRVIIELAAALAPHTAANIEALARAHYFDGLAILRLQDN